MKKNKESILNKKLKAMHFDAFNILNAMVFIAVLTMFVFSLRFTIRDAVNAVDKSGYGLMIVQRILIIFVMFIPSMLRWIFKMRFTKATTTFFYAFLFLAVYLGTYSEFYVKYEFYDMIVHFLFGILASFAALFFVNGYRKKHEAKLTPLMVFFVCFCFAMCVGGLWEIYEFLADTFFGMNMQKFKTAQMALLVGQDALLDTMLDMICNCLGALIASTVCALCAIYFPTFIKGFNVYFKKKKKIEDEQVENEKSKNSVEEVNRATVTNVEEVELEEDDFQEEIDNEDVDDGIEE